MTTHGEDAYELLSKAVGTNEGSSAWFEIDQARIDAFAEVTEDRQFIHVDPELSATLSPYGVTIAHGFLTLSMLSHLASSIPPVEGSLEGVVMGVNYGFEKVRFISPVKVGSSIRATAVLSGVELKDPDTVQATRTMTVEIQGETKPALVAEWVTRAIYG